MRDGGRRGIAGIGSALVDILVHGGDEFLKGSGASKGGMVYVPAEHIDRVMAGAPGRPVMVPGGAACNTLIGVGRLGLDARFVGQKGRDALGDLFHRNLVDSGVKPLLFDGDSPTGRVLSIITPDAQRSMLTCLGAAAECPPERITPDLFEDAAMVLVEGYLIFNRALIDAALAAAKAAGAAVALDLSSYTVVEQFRDELRDLVSRFVDVVIANEDEARAFTGIAEERESLSVLARMSRIAALKLGPRGALVARDGRVVTVPARPAEGIVDTTGAGDLWAAGFLAGLVRGMSLEKAGDLASLCGLEVCRVMGASIPDDGWRRIHAALAHESEWLADRRELDR